MKKSLNHTLWIFHFGNGASVHSSCALQKPFPKIVQMAKLDIPLRYNYLVLFMYGYSGNCQIK